MKTVLNTLRIVTIGSFLTGLGVSYVFALYSLLFFYIAYKGGQYAIAP